MVEGTEDLQGTLEVLKRYTLLSHSFLVTMPMYGTCICVKIAN